MKKMTFLAAIFAVTSISLPAKTFNVTSPDNAYRVTVNAGNSGTTYSVDYKGRTIIEPSPLGLQLSTGEIIGKGNASSSAVTSHRDSVCVVAGKNKMLPDNYNSLVITYNKGQYQLEARAYDEGIGLQWQLNKDGKLTVMDEIFQADFGDAPVKVLFPQCDTHKSTEYDMQRKPHVIHQGYRNFERAYIPYESIASIGDSTFSVTPVLFTLPGDSVRVSITESNVYDYPGLYLMGAGGEKIKGHWAAYPKDVMDDDPANPNRWYSTHLVENREDYIARIDGRRSLPWRVIIASDNDAQLLNNQLVYLLADPCEIADTSWIKPGKSAWEWWHKAMLEGVDFPVGMSNLNLPLYKYYVDWAAKNGIEYMTLDAGWKEEYIAELCQYAKERGVGIIVWTWISCPRQAPFDWVKKMKDYGVSGVKIDFFERNDQEAMRWQRDMARRVADQQMVILYHGCPTPNGLERTFPNILGYEGSRGQECNFWDYTISPAHHCTLPFTRALGGPHDFTPGSMRQATEADFKPRDIPNTVPMSRGTRAHEMALILVIDQWLASLCDSPTEYAKEPAIESYLSKVPTTYDLTLPIDGLVGKHVITARKSGSEWWVGAITGDEPYRYDLKLSFLDPDTQYDVEIIGDSADSVDHPRKYTVERRKVTPADTITIDMVTGGGAILHFTPRK